MGRVGGGGHGSATRRTYYTPFVVPERAARGGHASGQGAAHAVLRRTYSCCTHTAYTLRRVASN